MIKVFFVQISPTDPYCELIEMPAVPRVGDHIDLPGGINGDVRDVIWTPKRSTYAVEVRFR